MFSYNKYFFKSIKAKSHSIDNSILILYTISLHIFYFSQQEIIVNAANVSKLYPVIKLPIQLNISYYIYYVCLFIIFLKSINKLYVTSLYPFFDTISITFSKNHIEYSLGFYYGNIFILSLLCISSLKSYPFISIFQSVSGDDYNKLKSLTVNFY